MRLAIFGARGVPAQWGGFDTFVTELAPRLADEGHDVTLFTMPKSTGDDVGNEYEGVRIIRLPTVYGKFTETVLHEFLSSLYSLVRPALPASAACIAYEAFSAFFCPIAASLSSSASGCCA